MLALFGTPSGGELLLVLLVVLLLFGAKNLPRMARTLGRTLEEFRKAAREVTDEIVHADDDESIKRPQSLLKSGSTGNKKPAGDSESPPEPPPPPGPATPDATSMRDDS